mgnify:CR=1 FL=1
MSTAPTITPEFLSVADAAKLLAVSDRTLRRHIEHGRIPVYKVAGTAVRLRVSDVRALAQPIDPDGFAHQVDGAR